MHFKKDEFSEILTRNFNRQLEKSKEFIELPESLRLACSDLFNEQIDDIADKSLKTLSNDKSDSHGYIDHGRKLYMIVSVLPWSTEQTIDVLQNTSDEPSFGYVNFFNNLFINSWPSQDLTWWCHVCICVGDGMLEVHTGFGDYGGAPDAQRELTILPIGLLNFEEQRLIGL